MPEKNFFPPYEADRQPIGSIETSIEGSLGIVSLCGTIDSELEEDFYAASEECIENPQVDCLIFDFEKAADINSDLLRVLNDAHRRTMVAGKKLMMLRGVRSLTIQQLLQATGLDQRFAIEGQDDLEGMHRYKLSFTYFKPADH